MVETSSNFLESSSHLAECSSHIMESSSYAIESSSHLAESSIQISDSSSHLAESGSYSVPRFGYRGAFKLRMDNKFGEFTLPLRTSKINITQAIDRLFARVSRCRKAHLSSYGANHACSSNPDHAKHIE
jgi:hypothetical protein